MIHSSRNNEAYSILRISYFGYPVRHLSCVPVDTHWDPAMRVLVYCQTTGTIARHFRTEYFGSFPDEDVNSKLRFRFSLYIRLHLFRTISNKIIEKTTTVQLKRICCYRLSLLLVTTSILPLTPQRHNG